MNKLFEDIRTIAHKEIEKLKLTINESLDKLYEQARPTDQKIEERLPVKRLVKNSEPEAQKRQKSFEHSQKVRIEDFKNDPKEPKTQSEDHQRVPESRKPEDNRKSEEKKHEETKKIDEPKKTEDRAEKTLLKSSKHQIPIKAVDSNESDSDSVGLGSSDSDSEESSEESQKKKKTQKAEKIEVEPKPSKLSDLPKNRENLNTVIKALDDPGDRLEDIFDYFLAILDGSDQDLKDRISLINWDKKLKDAELSNFRKKVKKVVMLTSPTQANDHYKDLDIIKSKFEAAINRKLDSEINASFKRIDEKLRENLTEKEAPLLRETFLLVENLLKTSKNGEIRKSANSLREKISSKVESLTRKRTNK